MRKAAYAASFIILLLITISTTGISNAADTRNYEKALDLKILGLFSGTDKGFELERTPTRLEGAVMLLHLLGREKDAKRDNPPHPFSDVPAWADSYIGYMYANGLTAGSSSSTFGSDEPLTALQYVTFVLRSLGYDDKKNDFKFQNAIKKGIQAGIINSSEALTLENETTFRRDDLVGISYNALKAKLKASDKTLLDKLVNVDRIVYKPAATVLGLYTSDLNKVLGNADTYKAPVSQYGYVARNSDELFCILRRSICLYEQKFKIDIRNYSGDAGKDLKAVYGRASDAASKITGVDSIISSWNSLSDQSTITLTVKYRYSRDEFETRKVHAKEAINKARQIAASRIKPGMSDYNKEKILHDYIINNTRFDYENYLAGKIPDYSYEAYGCLVMGKAVCQGYSNAMKLLCDLSAVDCRVVTGEARNGNVWEGHAWNMVRIDGEYYHLDVTFDDPVIKNGVDALTYYYFNLPDSEMKIGARWKNSDYPVCSSLANNYYYKNNLLAGSKEDFINAVTAAVKRRNTQIELKVGGYTDKAYSDLSDIVFKTGSVSGFYYATNDNLGIVRIYDIKYKKVN